LPRRRARRPDGRSHIAFDTASQVRYAMAARAGGSDERHRSVAQGRPGGRGGGAAGVAMIVERVRGHSFIGEWLGPDSLIVDLGMHEGRFAAEMQARYGCRITGVEGNPLLAEKLGRTPRMQCFNLAIAPARGEVDFHIDPDNSEASGLARGAAGGERVLRVPGMRLAEFFAEQRIAEVDLLKIDIEGAEIELLAETDPRVFAPIRQICVEFHIFLFAGHARRVAAVLQRMRGMGFFAIDFSRNWEDALLINERRARLSEIDKLSLLGRKYRAGLGRMLRRSLRRATE
jgi:FkbM family methyltransferase